MIKNTPLCGKALSAWTQLYTCLLFGDDVGRAELAWQPNPIYAQAMALGWGTISGQCNTRHPRLIGIIISVYHLSGTD